MKMKYDPPPSPPAGIPISPRRTNIVLGHILIPAAVFGRQAGAETSTNNGSDRRQGHQSLPPPPPPSVRVAAPTSHRGTGHDKPRIIKGEIEKAHASDARTALPYVGHTIPAGPHKAQKDTLCVCFDIGFATHREIEPTGQFTRRPYKPTNEGVDVACTPPPNGNNGLGRVRHVGLMVILMLLSNMAQRPRGRKVGHK